MFYAFHMPLFLIISGFTFALAYVNPDGSPKSERLRVQLLDIAAVYVVFSAALVAFKVLFSGHVNTVLGFRDLLMIWKYPIAPYWYLYVLAVFYVTGALLLKYGRKLFVCSFYVSLVVSLASGWLGLTYAFCVGRMAFLFVFFLFGVGLQRGYFKAGWPLSIVAMCVSVLLFCVFKSADAPSFASCVSNVPSVNTIVAAGACMFIFKAFAEVAWLDNPLFRILGRYCLGIYVLHCFFTAGFRTLLPMVGITSFCQNFCLNLVLSTALSVSIPLALTRVGLHDALFRPVHRLVKWRKGQMPARH